MIGRGPTATHLMAAFDARYYGDESPIPSREGILAAITPYIARELADGSRMNSLTRHILGLYRPTRRRRFRQLLSDSRRWQKNGGAAARGVSDYWAEKHETPPLPACQRR